MVMAHRGLHLQKLKVKGHFVKNGMETNGRPRLFAVIPPPDEVGRYVAKA